VPDLRSKFLMGRENSTTNTVGMTGGESSVTLTLNQLPSHTHFDPGHSHSITSSIDTSRVSDHSHIYKVFFF
jgi:hypothetical protein